MALKPLNFSTLDKPNGIGIERVGQIQTDLGSRLSSLRENRDALVSAKAQPQLQQLREQEAVAGRHAGPMGSLQDRRRQEISQTADLGAQQIQSQALADQLQTEAGVQQLQNEFSASFNQMAATGFTEELSGLGEEIDRFMAKFGLEGAYSDLARKAEESANRMLGRFSQAVGQEFGRNKTTTQNTDFYSGTDVSQNYEDSFGEGTDWSE